MPLISTIVGRKGIELRGGKQACQLISHGSFQELKLYEHEHLHLAILSKQDYQNAP